MIIFVLSNGRFFLLVALFDQLFMEFEIVIVDDDIFNIVEKLFNFGKFGVIFYDIIQDILGRGLLFIVFIWFLQELIVFDNIYGFY